MITEPNNTKVIPFKMETISNTVIIHYTYTIRITEVGRGRSKACGTFCDKEEEEKEEEGGGGEVEEEIMAKTLGINVKELLSYICTPEL
jgi:hypothetical protein